MIVNRFNSITAFVAFLIVSISGLNSARAGGNEVGNGGDIFVCANQTQRAILVDLYEAQLDGRKLDFGPNNLSYKEKVLYTLDRWSTISPLRMEQYEKWLSEFENETRFIPGIELPNVPDEGIIAKPQGCELAQIVIQLSDRDLGTAYKRYTVSKDLWDLLDENNRAALVLHELIFREAILANKPVSMRVRFLNGLLLSNTDIKDYFDASKNLSGLFLEWGWAGISADQPRYSNFNPFAKLIYDSPEKMNQNFGNEVDRFWVRTKNYFLMCKRAHLDRLSLDYLVGACYNGNGEINLEPFEELTLRFSKFRSLGKPAKIFWAFGLNGSQMSGLEPVEFSDDLTCKNVSTHSFKNEDTLGQYVRMSAPSGAGECIKKVEFLDSQSVEIKIDQFKDLAHSYRGFNYKTDGKVSYLGQLKIPRSDLSCSFLGLPDDKTGDFICPDLSSGIPVSFESQADIKNIFLADSKISVLRKLSEAAYRYNSAKVKAKKGTIVDYITVNRKLKPQRLRTDSIIQITWQKLYDNPAVVTWYNAADIEK